MKRIVKGLHAYARQFHVSPHEALETLLAVIGRTLELHEAGVLTLDGDGDILFTCTLCQDEQWWRDNYGEWWEASRWWHCGPFGLECPGF